MCSNVDGLVFRKIFIFSASVVLGIVPGAKKYDNEETMTADWISKS